MSNSYRLRYVHSTYLIVVQTNYFYMNFRPNWACISLHPSLYNCLFTVSSPQQCYYCVEDDCETMSLWTNQTCATSQRSLGTSHCGTAAVRYNEGYLGLSRETMVKGCFDCTGSYKNLIGCLICFRYCHCFSLLTH